MEEIIHEWEKTLELEGSLQKRERIFAGMLGEVTQMEWHRLGKVGDFSGGPDEART